MLLLLGVAFLQTCFKVLTLFYFRLTKVRNMDPNGKDEKTKAEVSHCSDGDVFIKDGSSEPQ